VSIIISLNQITWGGQKGGGDLFLLSSTDKDQRLKAIVYSEKTLTQARKLGARAVVFYLGHVDMPNLSDTYRRLYGEGKLGKHEGAAFLDEQQFVRRTNHRANLDAVLFSLEKLNKVAGALGIYVGIENRYHFYEIPDFYEIGILLEKFAGGKVRYWHDVGHAHAQEALGILRHKDLLEAYSDKLVGIHFHDAQGLDDHLPPGEGEIYFEQITSFLRPSTIKILEINRRVERQALLKGIAHMKKFFDT
jgi:sugar phosphate isomerase/epimerase